MPSVSWLPLDFRLATDDDLNPIYPEIPVVNQINSNQPFDDDFQDGEQVFLEEELISIFRGKLSLQKRVPVIDNQTLSPDFNKQDEREATYESYGQIAIQVLSIFLPLMLVALTFAILFSKISYVLENSRILTRRTSLDPEPRHVVHAPLLGGPAYISCRDEKSKHTYRMVLSLNMRKDKFKKKEDPVLI